MLRLVRVLQPPEPPSRVDGAHGAGVAAGGGRGLGLPPLLLVGLVLLVPPVPADDGVLAVHGAHVVLAVVLSVACNQRQPFHLVIQMQLRSLPLTHGFLVLGVGDLQPERVPLFPSLAILGVPCPALRLSVHGRVHQSQMVVTRPRYYMP